MHVGTYRRTHVVTSVRYRHTSLSIVTHIGLLVWQTVIHLHAYANGACSYTVLSYAVISKYVQYTSVRYIAPYYWQRNKSYDNINFPI